MRNGFGTWLLLGVIVGVVMLTTLPYVLAELATGPDHVFGGFLLNPIDGNSYLAKMYQGWAGDWSFTLPYTAEAGEGAYLFTFYLFLGHLARLTGMSLPMTFHMVRVVSVLIMLMALFRFYEAIFPKRRQQRIAFIFAAFGSGMGWLAMMFGSFTSDFWVAEAYPFLSAYANPHFPLGLAILMWLLSPGTAEATGDGEISKRNVLKVLIGALGLGIVMPFGVVIVGLVLGGLAVWGYVAQRAGDHRTSLARLPEAGYRALLVLVGGGPVLVYYYWTSNTHLVLAGWNSQNVTPSPTFWDFIVSFSPILLVAFVGAWVAIRKGTLGLRVLLLWAGVGIFLLFVPFSLQRRFLMGLYIPLAGLATVGIVALAGESPRRNFITIATCLLLCIPTNLVILMVAERGIATLDESIYFTQGEAAAFDWIVQHTQPHALILAGPDTGLYIPAYTGRQVIYGHPFETVDAIEKENLVRQFFQNPHDRSDLDVLTGVDFIFVGPRERVLGGSQLSLDFPVVFRGQDVTIYQVGK